MLLTGGAGAAWAQTADVQRAELQEALPQARLVGQARLTYWGFQVYDARLWANPGFAADGFATQPLALELSYLRGFDSQAVAERSITEMRRSAPISDEQAAKWMAAMARVLPPAPAQKSTTRSPGFASTKRATSCEPSS